MNGDLPAASGEPTASPQDLDTPAIRADMRSMTLDQCRTWIEGIRARRIRVTERIKKMRRAKEASDKLRTDEKFAAALTKCEKAATKIDKDMSKLEDYLAKAETLQVMRE